MNKYTIGQIVYEVGINFSTHKASVRVQKILFIGERSLFVKGNDAVWGNKTETILFYSSKDNFRANDLFSSSTHTVWTDDKERAYHYAKQMNEIQDLKSNILKAV